MAKSKIINAHDKFVKEMFADKQMAIAFLENKLPSPLLSMIDLDSISYENNSFITKELSESFADIILKFKLWSGNQEMYLSILIENKSVPDPHVVFQLHEYLAGAYRKQLKTKEKLRPVVPFIYYHGDQDWKLKSIRQFFEEYPAGILDYIPTFETIFVSLKAMSDGQLSKIDNKMLYTALMVQRYRYDLKQLEDNLEQLLISLTAYSDWNFLKTIIVYSLDVTQITEEKIIEIANKGEEHLKDVIMSTYDQILEKGVVKGREEGIQRGREEGREIAIIDMILKGRDNKLDVAMLSNISGLAEDEVKAIIKSHGKA